MSEYFSGLDLGQAADFSALVITERTLRPHALHTRPVPYYLVNYIHRWNLGTSYASITSDLRNLYTRPPLPRSVLAIDRTGVGRGVYDMLRTGQIDARITGYTITAGQKPGIGTVPKKDLVSAIQVPLMEGRLTFSNQLELTATLTAELEHFRVKVTESRAEVFEAWRERDHDDLVLALALALYAGRYGGGFAAASTVVPNDAVMQQYL